MNDLLTFTEEDIALLADWEFREWWEYTGRLVRARAKARTSTSDTSDPSRQDLRDTLANLKRATEAVIASRRPSPPADAPPTETPHIEGRGDADSEARLELPVTIPADGSEGEALDSQRFETSPEPAISPAPATPVSAPDPVEPYPYACDRCGYEAAGPKSLETHEATCRVPFGSFVCPFCQRTDFATPQALGAHKRYKHPGGVS